jgi:hypothetical protein
MRRRIMPVSREEAKSSNAYSIIDRTRSRRSGAAEKRDELASSQMVELHQMPPAKNHW